MFRFLEQLLKPQAHLASGVVDRVHPGWPEYTPTVVLPNDEKLRLYPIRYTDGKRWSALRIADQEILEPVEPTVPVNWPNAHSGGAWRNYFSGIQQAATAGLAIPFVIELEGQFVGQITLGNIQHGIVSDCWIGYWVTSEHTGKGVATAACALGVDHAFSRIGVHRVTATYLPDNLASKRVLEANGFREEGYLQRNLHINGQWQDHFLVAQTVEDYQISCVERLRRQSRLR
ncbi:GNAT family N-acetyltransferase [Corynebacterium kutscheri]|uniref:Acetyltransferase n=1 Tax=Corynebacterium kutscheri TaxID=35755 RepID=A0AB38VNZ9_9CORY|nr:GNAT family protein [Corynebacterium kutscheri]VEH04302.1 acetyltransferase [Corynebacterium kutscheri]